MLNDWKPCKAFIYLQRWGSLPPEAMINQYISWNDILKDYKKKPSKGDLEAIYRIYSEG